MPVSSDKALPYRDHRKDMVLETTMEANVRRSTGQAAPNIGRVGVGACVKVLEDAHRPLKELKNATSGGHLEVLSVRCPV